MSRFSFIYIGIFSIIISILSFFNIIYSNYFNLFLNIDSYIYSLISSLLFGLIFLIKKKEEVIPTGTCLILITPDSERTMCTFLGIAGKISDKDIDENVVKNSELIFLEGYLWDEGEPKKAFNKAINISKKTTMSLSDQFCVERHKKNFFD